MMVMVMMMMMMMMTIVSPAGVTRDYDCEKDVPAGYDGLFNQWRDHNCALPGNETDIKVCGLSRIPNWPPLSMAQEA
jgi:hypothetical protein